MAEKMDDDRLLSILRAKEDDSGSYVWGALGQDREKAMRHYYRMPYGSEEEGWSQIVASDVQDSVEWALPDLLDQFLMTDKAVIFEPTRGSEVDGAKQATETVNYIFFKQNSGFLVLYTAIKDALTVRNCAVMWRKEKRQTVRSVPFKSASIEMLSMLMAEGGKDAEIESVDQQPMMGPDGQPMLDEFGAPMMVMSGRIKRTEERKIIKVEAFSPEDLLVERDWTSPLLAECPYVCRMMPVTLSDLHEMGYKDCVAEDLDDTDANARSTDANFRLSKVNNSEGSTTEGGASDTTDDDSMTRGWLRMEWVLVDADGDGIAERRQILRLEDKILSNEVVSHVPVATCSPILNTHRWDGMSLDDVVADIQELHTELLRGMLNNLSLANNPRKKVLVDGEGNPRANIEDLLDSRPGGVLRQFTPDAIGDDVTPFVAGATMPVMEYVQGMRENRTGLSRASMGLDPDSLNNTASGRRQDRNYSQKRMKLIARIFAEILLKPIFQGILKVATEGDMEKIAFSLRGQFVEYDPNEWLDQYDMTTTVGLGTGDQEAQARSLTTVMQSQMALIPFGITKPEHLYHTQTKIIENAGFKDVENFTSKPAPIDPNAPKQPPPEVQLKQMEIQGKMQLEQQKAQVDDMRHQREMERDIQVENAKQEAQARDSAHSRELDAIAKAEEAKRSEDMRRMELDFEWHREQLKAQTQIFIALATKQEAQEGPQEGAGDVDDSQEVRGTLQASVEALQAMLANINQPKMIIRDEMGRPVGIGPMQQPGAAA